MNSKTLKNFLYPAFLFLFCSCNHYYYAPEEGHLLTLSEKRDAKISVGGNSPNENPNNTSGKNFTFQAGYSPIDHLGVQGSFFKLNRIGKDHNGIEGKGNGHITSLALGTYYFFDKPLRQRKKRQKESLLPSSIKMKKGILVDLYGGYSFGNVQNFYINGSDSHLTFRKMYFQGGLHLQGKIMGLSYIMKGVRLDYESAILNGRMEQNETLNIEEITQGNPYFLMESSLRFQVGFRQFRFFMTANFINDSPSENNLDFIDSTFDIGLLIELDEFFRKR